MMNPKLPLKVIPLNAHEEQLHQALFAFSRMFLQMEHPYVSEDGASFISLSTERGFSYVHHEHNKTVKFTRFAQLADALDKIRLAFPDRNKLKEKTRCALTALFEFYMECVYSYISHEITSWPVLSNMIAGGHGRILDAMELLDCLADKARNNEINIGVDAVEFIPLHGLRVTLQKLQSRVKAIDVLALRDKEMQREMLALLKENFVVEFERGFEYVKIELTKKRDQISVFPGGEFADMFLKVTRPMWGLSVVGLVCEHVVNMIAFQHKEVEWVARGALALILMPYFIPSFSSNPLERLAQFFYCFHTASFVAARHDNYLSSRILLGVLLEVRSLRREWEGSDEGLPAVRDFETLRIQLTDLFVAQVEKCKALENENDVFYDADEDIFYDAVKEQKAEKALDDKQKINGFRRRC